ncbi:pyridoxal phosphate-dependent aminotransferase [Afifella marina]|uniref:Histidinol-phosphate aminotransferase n=2 Tax=Pseudomonadota TaxID=1224 RepID=A0A1G5NXG3_AFIMA|nr:aminotransferase class I/II-fold pyridoxal phosphate-dependent enzyme [Afifella marina]SCZ42037.1 histidinol-phosphate aminotransferase [Afifella marina DSM 2698]
MTLNPQSAEMSSTRLYEAETSPDLIAERYGLAREAVIDFSLNVNPFGPPPAAVEAAQRACGAIHLYPDLNYSQLRRALAARHRVDEGMFFFGAGLDDVIKLILQAWTSAEDDVLVHLPTFPRYELEASLRGCRIVAVENAEPELIDAGRIENALVAHKPALAFICSPNNPTGARLTRSEIAQLAEAAPETILVVDEALINPAEVGAVGLVANHRNLVVLRTFSKYFGIAGMRVGYAIASPDLVAVAEVGRPPFNLALPSLDAAIAALSDREFLARCKATFAEEFAHFLTEIASDPRLKVRGHNANMILLDLGGRDPGEAAENLARRGLIVADATSFHGLENDHVLRISLRSRADNDKLIKALKELP